MRYTNLTPQEFKTQYEADPNAILLDVRTPAEVAETHIEGHIHINLMHPDARNKFLALDKSKNYYIYCRSGNRSGQACNFLANEGFTGNLINLLGGILAWNEVF